MELIKGIWEYALLRTRVAAYAGGDGLSVEWTEAGLLIRPAPKAPFDPPPAWGFLRAVLTQYFGFRELTREERQKLANPGLGGVLGPSSEEGEDWRRRLVIAGALVSPWVFERGPAGRDKATWDYINTPKLVSLFAGLDLRDADLSAVRLEGSGWLVADLRGARPLEKVTEAFDLERSVLDAEQLAYLLAQVGRGEFALLPAARNPAAPPEGLAEAARLVARSNTEEAWKVLRFLATAENLPCEAVEALARAVPEEKFNFFLLQKGLRPDVRARLEERSRVIPIEDPRWPGLTRRCLRVRWWQELRAELGLEQYAKLKSGLGDLLAEFPAKVRYREDEFPPEAVAWEPDHTIESGVILRLYISAEGELSAALYHYSPPDYEEEESESFSGLIVEPQRVFARFFAERGGELLAARLERQEARLAELRTELSAEEARLARLKRLAGQS